MVGRWPRTHPLQWQVGTGPWVKERVKASNLLKKETSSLKSAWHPYSTGQCPGYRNRTLWNKVRQIGSFACSFIIDAPSPQLWSWAISRLLCWDVSNDHFLWLWRTDFSLAWQCFTRALPAFVFICLFIFGTTFSDAVCIGCFSMALCAFTGHSQTEKTAGKYSSSKHQTGFVVCVVCLSSSLPPLLFLLFSLFWSATLAFCNRWLFLPVSLQGKQLIPLFWFCKGQGSECVCTDGSRGCNAGKGTDKRSSARNSTWEQA